jgi:hypothetical protein
MISVFILLLVIFHYSSSYFNLYSTDNVDECLYFFGKKYPDDVNIIPCCIQQPILFPPNGHKTTFCQLRDSGIISTQFYEWLAPINIIESYQIYLELNNEDSIKNSEVFYNCSNFRFGSFMSIYIWFFGDDIYGDCSRKISTKEKLLYKRCYWRN